MESETYSLTSDICFRVDHELMCVWNLPFQAEGVKEKDVKQQCSIGLSFTLLGSMLPLVHYRSFAAVSISSLCLHHRGSL